MMLRGLAFGLASAILVAMPASADDPAGPAAAQAPAAAQPAPAPEASEAPAAPAQADATAAPSPVHIDSCASDRDRLGISRVVEIDPTAGPQFGGGHGASNDFLHDGEVVLTFDDGPMRAYTRHILKALADHCTKATFFMVGRMAVADPAMVREVAAAGHTIGIHTWSHKNLGVLGMTRGRQELEAGISAVSKANGVPVAPFFRYPYLSGSRVVDGYMKSRNIATFWVDVDSKDYMTRDPRSVFNRVMAQLERSRKGIILMHDIHVSSARAINTLLDTLHDKGFKVVHIVPKSSLTTVAEFDAQAERALAAKAQGRATSELASRSFTWGMEPDDQGTTAKPRAKRAGSARKSGSAKSDTVSSNAGSGLDPADKAKKRPAKSNGDELPWQMKIFNF